MEQPAPAKVEQKGEPEHQNIVLHAVRPRQARGNNDAARPRPLECEPDGSLKIRPRVPPMRRLASGTLAGSDTVIFTAQTDYDDVQIVVSLVDTSARTFNLYHVESGGSVADNRALAKAVNLAVNGPPLAYSNLGLTKGDTIRGLCSTADKANVVIYGRAI